MKANLDEEIIMDERLRNLYLNCVNELKSINIDVTNKDLIGEIDISFSKRNSKRYGCCKQENPDKSSYRIIKRGRKKIVKYDKFGKHHIEISKWVMDLDEKIIKNTIMHEIIHCFPGCNDHGSKFKSYSKYINQKLGYNISRLGNKEEDYKNSNLEYKEDNKYNYKVFCVKCGQTFHRQRLNKNLFKHYRCGNCGGKFDFEKI